MFSTIKLKIANYILEKDLKKDNRNSHLVLLSKTKKIGILFDAEDVENTLSIKSLLKYFLKKNIDVDVLGFVNKSKMEDFHLSTIHVSYFNLKSLNLLGIPNSQKTKDFISKEYDILINLSFKDSFPTRYLTMKSHSKFTVGIFANNYNLNYDLMFKLKIKSLDYFITHLRHYLELINKNNEK